VGLKPCGTRLLLAYADDVNLLGDSIETVKILTDASKQVGLGVKVGKCEV
jgi:hypothetical protein